MSDQELLERLDKTIRFVVTQDLPFLTEWKRDVVVGHLTGAVFVSLRDDEDDEEATG